MTREVIQERIEKMICDTCGKTILHSFAYCPQLTFHTMETVYVETCSKECLKKCLTVMVDVLQFKYPQQFK